MEVPRTFRCSTGVKSQWDRLGLRMKETTPNVEADMIWLILSEPEY